MPKSRCTRTSSRLLHHGVHKCTKAASSLGEKTEENKPAQIKIQDQTIDSGVYLFMPPHLLAFIDFCRFSAIITNAVLPKAAKKWPRQSCNGYVQNHTRSAKRKTHWAARRRPLVSPSQPTSWCAGEGMGVGVARYPQKPVEPKGDGMGMSLAMSKFD